MKKAAIYLFLTWTWLLHAQQTIMYTQYNFNQAGLNPAASGASIEHTYYYAFGMNRQWVGFDNAPKSNFFNFSYTIRPPRSYRYWQNAGIYLDSEDSGLLGNAGAYLNYTFHLLVRKKMVCSFGIYGGVRRFERSRGQFDNNDPAVRNSRQEVIAYPDLIPGLRLSDRRFFMDLSVRQLTVFRQQDFNANRIGSGHGSKLQPTIYFDLGRKLDISERTLVMPSFALNLPLVGFPLIDLNVMVYYAKRIGAGVSLRNASFASAILQIRFLRNLTAGFAYSYPVNRTRLVAPNSFEIMVGIVPFGMEEKTSGRHSVARCPHLNY